MRRIDLNLNLNPFVAVFVITVIGSGAAFLIVRTMEIADVVSAGPVIPL